MLVVLEPNNLLARSICGDVSDNIEGVGSVALKGLSQRMSFLKNKKEATIEEIIDYCKNQEKKLKMYENIINSEEKIKENYSLMQLSIPNISILTKHAIENTLKNFKFQINRTKIVQELIKLGINIDFSDLFVIMNGIIKENEKV
jgi:5'-3' exonuclease